MVPAPMLGQCGVRACVGHASGMVRRHGSADTWAPPGVSSHRSRCLAWTAGRAAPLLGAPTLLPPGQAVAAEEVGPAISEGHVRALRDSTYSLLDAAPATTRLRSHLAHGKIVLTMS